jgi:hypothetical protein
MGTDVAVTQTNLPAHLQQQAPVEKEFSGGVQSGFPVVSFRGKVWRVKKSGEEQVYTDPATGDAIQTIEAVLVKSNENLSKTFYEGKYSEGDSGKPRCWSSDGVKPDQDVPNPVNSLCAGCPMDQWGSRVTDEGKKMKACQDVRRVALLLGHELEAIVSGQKAASEADAMLLRIPPATLNPLKDYAERVLAPKGASPFMLLTKIGFEIDASYPKLTFKGERWLSEAEFGVISELRDSDVVKRIINTSAEHVTEGTTDNGGDAASSESNVKAEAPASAPSGALQAEEAGFSQATDEIAPPPPPPPAPVAEAPIAPAPPEPTRPAAVEEQAAETIAQPPQAEASAPEPAPSTPAAAESTSPDPANDEDIDGMLSSILD